MRVVALGFVLWGAIGPVAFCAEHQKAIVDRVPPVTPVGAIDKIISPIVTPDGRVTFRVRAPQASNVEMRGSIPSAFAPVSMPLIKDADGVWSATSGPLEPDIYFYNFIIDGVPALDPNNAHTRRDGMRIASTFIVSGARSAPYVVKAVPHGTVSQVWYDSPSLKLRRRADIYTPPGYEHSDQRFPVLYLLHGGFGDEDAWVSNGRVPQILDNFIAEGRIAPMIVVMPNGNATQSASPDYIEEMEPQGSFFSMEFPDSLVSDLVPFIDATYRTRSDRSDRAIAGLSMGGAHALWAAFHHLETFAWVESMSGGYMILPNAGVYGTEPAGATFPGGLRMPMAIDPGKVLADLPELTPGANARLSLFALAVGVNDGLAPQQRTLQAELAAKGIKVEVIEVPGYSHEWSFWRTALVDMLPRLFRPREAANSGK
jgi:enterochelin esterase-like enzyme